jgi:XTP/dITP diphosphohydrolase
MKLVIATTSAHKISEIRGLLSDVPDLQVLALVDFPPIDEPEEDGDSMATNARIKAEYYTRHTGLPTLADDSGLEVDALGGEPGVHSARWAPGSDADRTQALLSRMLGVPDENRTARYRCALCAVLNARTCVQLEATCEGRIAHAPRGDNGFGYDPIFEITDTTHADASYLGQTMAQVPPGVKAQVSHRARAVSKLAHELQRRAAQP